MRPSTLAGALVDEIERVVVLRERHRRLGADIGRTAEFMAGFALLTLAIDGAKRAVDTGDLVAMIAGYRELRSFDDEL